MAGARILDGKTEAKRVRASLCERIAERTRAGRAAPGLVTILVGDDPASEVYVGHKQRAAGEVGMHSESERLAADTSMDRLLAVVDAYNRRADIHGILVQLPLPEHLDADKVIAAVDPAKDVDGLTPTSQGRLFTGRPGLRPCTPSGCMHLLASAGVDPAGKHAVVVGRSILVGKPVAMMLLERHATVTLCHSRTPDLAETVGRGDIVVAAVGRPGLVRGSWIREGAVVIDVGINRTESGLVGDVDYPDAAERASWITPVPGGVGPMTVAMLLENTWQACLAADSAP